MIIEESDIITFSHNDISYHYRGEMRRGATRNSNQDLVSFCPRPSNLSLILTGFVMLTRDLLKSNLYHHTSLFSVLTKKFYSLIDKYFSRSLLRMSGYLDPNFHLDNSQIRNCLQSCHMSWTLSLQNSL